MSEGPDPRLLSADELEGIGRRWKASSASSRAYGGSAWKAESGSYTGHDFLVASCGCDGADGLEYYVVTDGVHASELAGGAAEDAVFIANCPRDIRRLMLGYLALEEENSRLRQANEMIHITGP